MTVYSYTFTGTNGTALPSPWVVNLFGTGSFKYFRIESNTAEANQSSDAYHGQVANWGSTVVDDLDVKVKIIFNATDAESYPAIGFRMSGGTGGWVDPWAEVYNGYCAYLDNLLNKLVLQRQSGGSTSQSWETTGKIINSGAAWWLRTYVLGTAIKIKTWNDSGSEPGAWDIEITDATWADGIIGLRGQAQTVNVKTRFDDVSIDDFASSGTHYTDTGLATVVTSTTATINVLAAGAVSSNTATATHMATDRLAVTATGATSLTASTGSTDSAGVSAGSSTSIASTVGTTDSLNQVESLASVITSTTDAEDLLASIGASTTSIQSETQTTETVGMNETSDTVIGSDVSSGDIGDFIDDAGTVITSTDGFLDLLSITESGSHLIVSDIQITDQLNSTNNDYFDSVSIVITSSVDSDDSSDSNASSETVIVSTAEASAALGQTDFSATEITSSVSSLDQWGAVDSLANVAIVTTATSSLVALSNSLFTLIVSTVESFDSASTDEPAAGLIVSLRVDDYFPITLTVDHLIVALTIAHLDVNLEVV